MDIAHDRVQTTDWLKKRNWYVVLKNINCAAIWRQLTISSLNVSRKFLFGAGLETSKLDLKPSGQRWFCAKVYGHARWEFKLVENIHLCRNNFWAFGRLGMVLCSQTSLLNSLKRLVAYKIYGFLQYWKLRRWWRQSNWRPWKLHWHNWRTASQDVEDLMCLWSSLFSSMLSSYACNRPMLVSFWPNLLVLTKSWEVILWW
jgi:hypothetical protein